MLIKLDQLKAYAVESAKLRAFMVCVIFVEYAMYSRLFIFHEILVGGKIPTAVQLMEVLKTMCKITTSIRRFVPQLTSLWRPVLFLLMSNVSAMLNSVLRLRVIM